MVRSERLTATLEGDFVVFLIGMRVNRPWKIHRWWPVASAMTGMLKELEQQPQLGLLHGESWAGRTTLMLQYWRSMEQLLAYATDRQALHLPAWRAFNQAIGANGDVGVWHETYVVSPGRYENIYVNMPPFGLGAVGTTQAATGERRSAASRLQTGAAR